THHQDVRSFNRRLFPILLYTDLAGTFIPPPALHPLYFVLFEKKLDALGVFLDDLVFPRERRAPVEFGPAYFNPIFCCVLDVVIVSRGMQKLLRRYATDMQARPAEVRIFFDDNRLQPQLTGSYGRDVPAGTAPDYRHIVLCHSRSPFGWNPSPGPDPPQRILRRVWFSLSDFLAGIRSFWRLPQTPFLP